MTDLYGPGVEHVQLRVDHTTRAAADAGFARTVDLGAVPLGRHWHLYRAQFWLNVLTFSGEPAYLTQLVTGSRPGAGDPGNPGDRDPSWLNATGRRSDVVASCLVDLALTAPTRAKWADDSTVRAHLDPGTPLWFVIYSTPTTSRLLDIPGTWTVTYDFVATAAALTTWG